jgi:DNA-binding response OmpR family regulator
MKPPATSGNALDENGILRVDCIEVNLTSKSASRAGRPLSLKPRQFDLLTFLMRNPNRVVSQDEIAAAVWGEPTATWTNVIAVSVHDLRKELEQPGKPTVLHTVRGRGYFLGAELPETGVTVSPATVDGNPPPEASPLEPIP